jgi:NTE family protein
LDALAQSPAHELPLPIQRANRRLGVMKGGGGALASHLLFEPAFVQALVAPGEHDAYARKQELLPFVSAQTA